MPFRETQDLDREGDPWGTIAKPFGSSTPLNKPSSLRVHRGKAVSGAEVARDTFWLQGTFQALAQVKQPPKVPVSVP